LGEEQTKRRHLRQYQPAIAGPTHQQELPVGRHPLQLYSLAVPNGQKVTILLEELLALGNTTPGRSGSIRATSLEAASLRSTRIPSWRVPWEENEPSRRIGASSASASVWRH
jgi:hypothetical protein